MARSRKATAPPDRLREGPTGMVGLDNVTEGGWPSPLCGSAGSGTTPLGMEFIFRGITLPQPVRQIIGDPSDAERVVVGQDPRPRH